MVERVLENLVFRLAEQELIELVEGCTPEDLAHELIERLAQGTDQGTGFLSWFIDALIKSPHVEELFASDDDIRQIFHGIR